MLTSAVPRLPSAMSMPSAKTMKDLTFVPVKQDFLVMEEAVEVRV